MSLNIAKEVVALEQMTVGQLQDRYVEVFGEPVRSRHKQYLIRRIAWRLQANAEGGLSERALRRAEELANVADVRVMPPQWATPVRQVRPAGLSVVRMPVPKDPRLPSADSQITRKYKGRTIIVRVLADGFEYLGERYRSLTTIAKAITRVRALEERIACEISFPRLLGYRYDIGGETLPTAPTLAWVRVSARWRYGAGAGPTWAKTNTMICVDSNEGRTGLLCLAVRFSGGHGADPLGREPPDAAGSLSE